MHGSRPSILEFPVLVYYITITPDGRFSMDFIRDLQTRDWVVAAIAFVAGAFIF